LTKLQLVKANDEDTGPVAEYHPHKRHLGVWRMSSRAYLEVKPEACDSLDKIIGDFFSLTIESLDIADQSFLRQ